MQEEDKGTLEKIIDQISEERGIPRDRLKKNTEDWVSALMEKGVVVSLEIKRWRANSKVEADEIGIDGMRPSFIKYDEEYLNLGTKKLLPKSVLKEISSIESRARKNLKERSLDTPWGHFVPHTSFREWKEQNDVIRIDYFNKANEIASRWEELKEEVCQDYLEFVTSTYKDKIALATEEEKAEINAKISSLRSNFEAEIITAEKFREEFEYDCFYTYIPLPSVLKKDLLEREQIESEAEMNQKIREEMYNNKSRYIEEFIEATAGAITETTERVLQEVRIAIGSDGQKEVNKRTKNKLLKLIKTVRSLDFYQEEKTIAALDRLEVDLNKKGKEKKTFADIKSALDDFELASKSMMSSWVRDRASLLEV